MSNGSKVKAAARGASSTSVTVNMPDITSKWLHLALVYNGTTLSCYTNGALSASSTIAAATDNGYPLSFGCDSDGSESAFNGQYDEIRLVDAVATPTWVAAEYAVAANASALSYGEATDLDDTAPAFATPTVVKNVDGTFSVSVSLTDGEGDLYVIYNDAITNALSNGYVAAPQTYTNTPANLVTNTCYAYAVFGTNANGTAVTKLGADTFLTGEVSVEKTADADEYGLAPGAFTFSRPANDEARLHDLAVAYTVGGTAVAGQNYVNNLTGTLVIPAGEASATLVVTPLIDATVTEDTTVVLTISDGLYYLGTSSATMTITNLAAPAGYNTWVATEAGKASVGQNWSEGRVPNSTDNILFDGRFSTSDCEWDGGVNGLPATVKSWTQNAEYTGAVTICTLYPEVAGATFTNFTVTGNMTVEAGKITQVANDIQKEEYRLRLSVGGNLAVTSPGMIDVSAKGPRGVMAGRAENTYGGDAGSFGKAFDDPKYPYFCGSGNNGGWSANYKSAGGGAAWIEVGGAVSLSGSIRANGGRFQNTVSGELTSGGNIGTSGGSVYLKAASLSGSGTIQASAIVSGDNKAASGGRIAVELTGAANALPLDNIKAWADAGIAGHCGVGTIVVKNPGQANGTLILRGNSAPYFSYNSTISDITRLTSIPAASEWTFDAILLGDFGQLVVPAGCTLNLPNGFASVTASNLVSNANSLYASGILVRGGTVNAPAVGAKHTFGGGKWTFHPASNFVFNADVVVKEGANLGTLAMASTAANAYRCWFTVNGNLTVESTGVMRAENGGIGGNGTAQDAGAFIVYPFGKTWGTGHGGRTGCSA
jgi:hypothetical protein